MTYGYLRRVPGGWEVSGIPPHVAIRFKDIFRQVSKTRVAPFVLSDNPETCLDLEWFMRRYPLEMSAEDSQALMDKASNYVEWQERSSQFFDPSYVPREIEMREGKVPHPYQRRAIELFWERKRLLVADQVGLGKTVIGMGALTKPEFLPALVVVQPHLIHQWEEMFNEWTHHTTHKIMGRKNYKLPARDVIITKYSILSRWTDTLAGFPFKTVIADEIQELRRTTSQKSMAFEAIADSIPNVMGLSGSPIYNYGIEAFNIFDHIDPDIFPSRDEFIREWCTGDKVRDPKALGTYLQDQRVYIRRTDEDVQHERPKKPNRFTHKVGYDDKEIKKLESEAKTLAHQVLQGSFIERGQAAQQLSVMARKYTGVSKARGVANYVRMILESGERVLLAGWHRKVYEIWLDELKDFNPVMYTGSESPARKNKTKQKFIEGDSRLMIISLRSGVGLDGLQHVCSFVVFGELDWSPAIHEQVIGRLDRYGQKRQVQAIFLTTDSGSDPVVVDLLGLKKSQSKGIFDPKRASKSSVGDDSIIKEFARRYVEGGQR